MSVPNPRFKVCERVMKEQIVCRMESVLQHFLSAYRENYSSQNILLSLIEEWRKNLDNFVVGAVRTNLSKAFDGIPYGLFSANLSAYNLLMKLCLIFLHTWLIAMRPYKQHMQSALGYNFGCPTGIYFEADFFQPINKWYFPFCGSSISLLFSRWQYPVCICYHIFRIN